MVPPWGLMAPPWGPMGPQIFREPGGRAGLLENSEAHGHMFDRTGRVLKTTHLPSHPAAVQMLRSVAKVRARREASTGAEILYRQLLARVIALVWRRAARMAIRCRPRRTDDDADAAVVVDAACGLRAGEPGTVELPAV